MSAPPEIFSINFIRHESVPMSVRRVSVYLILVYLILSAVALSFLLTASMRFYKERQALSDELSNVAPEDRSVENMQLDLTNTRAKLSDNTSRLGALIAAQKFHIADKWCGLASTFPDDVWITEMSSPENSKIINISAVYVDARDKPFEAFVHSWTETLKNDSRFGRGLKEIKLTRSAAEAKTYASLYSLDLSSEWNS